MIAAFITSIKAELLGKRIITEVSFIIVTNFADYGNLITFIFRIGFQTVSLRKLCPIYIFCIHSKMIRIDICIICFTVGIGR